METRNCPEGYFQDEYKDCHNCYQICNKRFPKWKINHCKTFCPDIFHEIFVSTKAHSSVPVSRTVSSTATLDGTTPTLLPMTSLSTHVILAACVVASALVFAALGMCFLIYLKKKRPKSPKNVEQTSIEPRTSISSQGRRNSVTSRRGSIVTLPGRRGSIVTLPGRRNSVVTLPGRRNSVVTLLGRRGSIVNPLPGRRGSLSFSGRNKPERQDEIMNFDQVYSGQTEQIQCRDDNVNDSTSLLPQPQLAKARTAEFASRHITDDALHEDNIALMAMDPPAKRESEDDSLGNHSPVSTQTNARRGSVQKRDACCEALPFPVEETQKHPLVRQSDSMMHHNLPVEEIGVSSEDHSLSCTSSFHTLTSLDLRSSISLPVDRRSNSSSSASSVA